MKGLVFLGILLSFFSSYSFGDSKQMDWSQPPALCPEEVIPGLENMKRVGEKYLANPLSLKSGDEFEDSYINVKAPEDISDKISTIYESANYYEMPVSVLLGSLAQESSFADDSLGRDGGNYACGIAQLNVVEWCLWGRSLNEEQASALQFPKSDMEKYDKENPHGDFCNSDYMDPKLVEPFMNILINKFKVSSPNQMPMENYKKLSFQSMKGNLSGKTEDIQKLQYDVSQSFFGHCAEHRVSIPALAYILNDLYKNYVPTELKSTERYSAGEHFYKSCKTEIKSNAYPFNTGWVLTDVMFNCGEKIVQDISKIKTQSWSDFNPTILVGYLKTLGLNHHISAVINRASDRAIFPRK
jgi:hypothetical protein